MFVSDAAVAVLGDAELHAVVEHEAHHARRRDPLRLAAAQTTADAFGFLPPLRDLARKEAALADLAADRAAVAAVARARRWPPLQAPDEAGARARRRAAGRPLVALAANVAPRRRSSVSRLI